MLVQYEMIPCSCIRKEVQSVDGKAVGTDLRWGGCKIKLLRKILYYITLTYKKDTILFISISVISKIN